METSNGVYGLTEEDVLKFLIDKHLEFPGSDTTLLYQEDDRPVVKKKVAPFPTGSHHVIVPAPIAKNFKDVFLLPVKKEEMTPAKKKVFKGRTVKFGGEDVYVLLNFKEYELADAGLDLEFCETGVRPFPRKDVTKYSTRGYHAIVPADIAREYTWVFIVPGERKFEDTDEVAAAEKLLEAETQKEETEFFREVDEYLEAETQKT